MYYSAGTYESFAHPETVCVACAAMHCGAESGAIYGLVCGTVWCFTGASGCALHIVLLTLCGAVVPLCCTL